MLRRANDHEAAAFFLVERTIQRTRPRSGALGLKSLQVPDGTIERGSLGRLRVRFDGDAADVEPENREGTRPPSDEEVNLWSGLERMLSSTRPVTDPGWNLVSMQIGSRTLRRLPLGGVVTFLPDGTPPFQGSFQLSRPKADLHFPRPEEAEMLAAIDAFLRELEFPWGPDLGPQSEWIPRTASGPQANHVLSLAFGHSRHMARGKWHRCPLCHTPVVKGMFNPRIPYGALRPGVGAIRDLRGGYLTRLRDTYLIAEPDSLFGASGAPLLPGAPGDAGPSSRAG